MAQCIAANSCSITALLLSPLVKALEANDIGICTPLYSWLNMQANLLASAVMQNCLLN